MDSVLTGGREACVACSSNFKPLACLVAEISAEKSFPIVTVSQDPTIGFRCEPSVSRIGRIRSWQLYDLLFKIGYLLFESWYNGRMLFFHPYRPRLISKNPVESVKSGHGSCMTLFENKILLILILEDW